MVPIDLENLELHVPIIEVSPLLGRHIVRRYWPRLADQDLTECTEVCGPCNTSRICDCLADSLPAPKWLFHRPTVFETPSSLSSFS